MKQMYIDDRQIVPLNYEDDGLPAYVRELRPVVFRTGHGYCCLLGPDLGSGITGTGNTPEEALANWERALRQRLTCASENDEVALYAGDMLKTSNKQVW